MRTGLPVGCGIVVLEPAVSPEPLPVFTTSLDPVPLPVLGFGDSALPVFVFGLSALPVIVFGLSALPVFVFVFVFGFVLPLFSATCEPLPPPPPLSFLP